MGTTEEPRNDPAVDPAKADHICILVHGLWGKPSHLERVAGTLREKYPADKLHVLVAERNQDSLTYDGIEVGGERLAQEIEDELEKLEKRGNRITKISIVGYSLGGLIARYCIGLFFSRGLFKKLQPINFTAFASPFLGTLVPNKGYHSYLYNLMASQLISVSGRQLFLADNYRDSGRPLIEVLTDPQSIFISGLKQFRNRALYANIINDRSAPWFTTGISCSDPFVDLDAVQLNYMKGYDSVMLDPENPVQLKKTEELDFYSRAFNSGSAFVTKAPLYALGGILIPIGFTAFAINAGFETIRSNRRLQLHNSGKAGKFDIYHIPYLLESAIESANATEPHEYLSGSDAASSAADPKEAEQERVAAEQLRRVGSRPDFPTLALDPKQFRMIDVLSEVGFRKYPVHISKARHSHAAIIVRKTWDSMDEGYVVLQHWVDHEFEI